MCRKIGGKFINFLLLLNRFLDYILSDFKKEDGGNEESEN